MVREPRTTASSSLHLSVREVPPTSACPSEWLGPSALATYTPPWAVAQPALHRPMMPLSRLSLEVNGASLSSARSPSSFARTETSRPRSHRPQRPPTHPTPIAKKSNKPARTQAPCCSSDQGSRQGHHRSRCSPCSLPAPTSETSLEWQRHLLDGFGDYPVKRYRQRTRCVPSPSSSATYSLMWLG